MNTISLENIETAAGSINPIYLNSPQYRSEGLSGLLNLSLVCKVETVNPIGCFKGRGVDWWARCNPHIKQLVCLSSGNLGQALAYVGREMGIEVHIFTIETANPTKVKSMEALDAIVHLHGKKYREARAEAARFAKANDFYLLIDEEEFEISEGAGTIAVELGKYPDAFDVLYVPVGGGTLINGVGTWFKANSPETKIIGVCAKGAPAMQLSWREGRVVCTDTVDTIADGVTVSEPVSQSVELLTTSVNEIVLVDDPDIIQAMHAFYKHEKIVLEPAGAISLAAAMVDAHKNVGKTVGIILSGSNISPQDRDKWF